MANIEKSSLANLPDKLLANITLRVARLSWIDGATLGKVSKAFSRHWKSQIVRSECHLGPLTFVPTIEYSDAVRSLFVAMKGFCEAENPETLYREGIPTIFDNRRIDRLGEGLTQLQAAAKKGPIKVRFLYGLILVCTVIERRDEDFDMLATLMKPTLIESIYEMLRPRNDLIYRYLEQLQGGVGKTVELLVEYDPDSGCDRDYNRKYMDYLYAWREEAIDSLSPK